MYAAAQSTAELHRIPVGSYALLFQTGHGWRRNRFCESHRTAKFRESFDFTEEQASDGLYYSSYRITLQPVPGGTASTESVSAEEFAEDQEGGEADMSFPMRSGGSQ
jgi:hypothetical protein